MATLKELEDALLKADAANDTESATVLANEIRRLRAEGSKPERAGSTVAGTIHSLGTGIAQGSIALGNSLSEWPARIEDKVAGWMGVLPEDLNELRQSKAQLGIGTPRTTADIQAKIEEKTGPFYQSQGVAEDYANTLGQFIPSVFAGPGKTTIQAIKSGVLPTLLGAVSSETAGQATKDSWLEPYARFVGGFSGGLLGGGINNWWSKPEAPIQGVSPKAQSNVGNALNDTFGGDVGKALARGDELGPEAMVMNLGRRPATQAATVARYPGESSAIVGEAVNKQIMRSGARAAEDWDKAVGPSVSRYEATIQAAKQKSGVSGLYEIAKGRPVDPSPIHSTIIKELTEAGNDPQTRAAIKEISDLLLDPNTGALSFNKAGSPSIVGGTQAFVNDAGALVNARIRLSEMIVEQGKKLSNTPGVDLFALGKRTSVGSRLNAIRKAINETLHQDDTLKAADKIWSSAERTQNAFEFGRTKLLGRGDSVIEPEALTAKLANPNLTIEERAAISKGLSRKGTALLGDVSPNRNDGKAMGAAIATPNNLSRIAQVSGSGAAERVKRMAAREDLFAKDAARATGNSVTSDVLQGQTEFPSPMLGNKEYANVRQTTLLGAGMEGATRLVDALTRGVISNNRSKLASDAAKLLTKTGAERDAAVRSLMDYSNKLPKGHPLKAVIAQAVAPALASATPGLLGR